jgi:hypothetical protein
LIVLAFAGDSTTTIFIYFQRVRGEKTMASRRNGPRLSRP